MAIRQLDPATIAKIAAGEVVQRPVSALKELLENSLDAGARTIEVTLREGGMELLQVKDDGSGVAAADLPLLCCRFATSKLASVQDLSRLRTFGFRGEALASLSRVAQVTVHTRTPAQQSGLRARYRDEELVQPPESCAMAVGTSIAAENMFASMPGRRESLGSASEELHDCLHLVQLYAIQRCSVKFSVTSGERSNILATPGAGRRLALLQQLYKHPPLERELLPLQCTEKEVVVEGFASNANYSLPKTEFILFVNDRLVESEALRTALLHFYAAYTPDHFLFVYLSLSVPPELLDVNLHPTKREVKFAHETQVFNSIQTCLQTELSKSEQQRTLVVRSLTQSTAHKGPASQVRTDWTNSQLDWKVKASVPLQEPTERLRSVYELRSAVVSGDLQPLFDQFTFVGCVDVERVLVQYGTGLYLVQVGAVIEELAYQYILDHFGQLPSLPIPPRNVSELISEALDQPRVGYSSALHGSKERLIGSAMGRLEAQKQLLEAYFGLKFEQGQLTQVPQVCEGNLVGRVDLLGELLLRLTTEVLWNAEKTCLDGVSRELAWWFAEPVEAETYEETYRLRIFPYLRGRLKADVRNLSLGRNVVKVTATEDLYQVFERC